MKGEILKALKTLVIVVAVFFVILATFWISARNLVIKKLIEHSFNAQASLEITVGSVGSAVLFNNVYFENVKIYRHNGKKKELFADVPKIVLGLDLRKLLKPPRRIKLFDIYIKTITIIIGMPGEAVDEDRLTVLPSPRKTKGANPSGKIKDELVIDDLILSLDKVIYKNGPGGNLLITSINLKNQIYKNVTASDLFKGKILERYTEIPTGLLR